MGQKPQTPRRRRVATDVVDPVGWRILRTKMTPTELRNIGPTLEVTLADPATPRKTRSVYALIDTGASHSHVSQRLAAMFTSPATGRFRQSLAGGETNDIPAFGALITLPDGVAIETEIGVLARLQPPHDLLIGRNLLRACRVIVDFTSGVWALALKIRAR
jgi:predicted aspartyl protease